MIYQGNARHPVKEVIIHCSATPLSWMKDSRTSQKVAEIALWHTRDNGWKAIGYHWLIDRDGTVAKGRAETVVGAHVAGHNSGTIGICLIGGGGSKETDLFAHNYTSAQREALLKLIGQIKGRTPIQKITGHNQYAAKACPGFNVPRWLKEEGL